MWEQIKDLVAKAYPECEMIGENAVVACGDSDVVTHALPEKIACVADPPYGIGYMHRSRIGHKYGNDGDVCVGDDLAFDPRHLLKFRHVVLWGANHYSNALPSSASWLVWNKRCGRTTRAQSDAEMAWTNNAQRKSVRMFDYYWTGVQARELGEPNYHVMQKPVALMRWCLESLPAEDPIVYDPYMGCGTTGLAASQLGLRYVGVEIEPRHYRVARSRVSDAYINTLAM